MYRERRMSVRRERERERERERYRCNEGERGRKEIAERRREIERHI